MTAALLLILWVQLGVALVVFSVERRRSLRMAVTGAALACDAQRPAQPGALPDGNHGENNR